jgi:hypothetical protein
MTRIKFVAELHDVEYIARSSYSNMGPPGFRSWSVPADVRDVTTPPVMDVTSVSWLLNKLRAASFIVEPIRSLFMEG